MSQFLSVIFVLFILIMSTRSLEPGKCQKTPKDKHCLIEYSVRDRWPHTVRYVYNWYMKNCFEIRWSAHCPAVPVPTTENNFTTEQECLAECGGWA